MAVTLFDGYSYSGSKQQIASGSALVTLGRVRSLQLDPGWGYTLATGPNLPASFDNPAQVGLSSDPGLNLEGSAVRNLYVRAWSPAELAVPTPPPVPTPPGGAGGLTLADYQAASNTYDQAAYDAGRAAQQAGKPRVAALDQFQAAYPKGSPWNPYTGGGF